MGNLVKGKMPSKENGMHVIGNEKFSSLSLKIGDKLLLTSGDDSDISESLKNIEYEIVEFNGNTILFKVIKLEVVL